MDNLSAVVVLLISITGVTWAIIQPFIKDTLLFFDEQNKEIKGLENQVTCWDSNGDILKQQTEYGDYSERNYKQVKNLYYWIWTAAVLNVTLVVVYFVMKYNLSDFGFSSNITPQKISWYFVAYYFYNGYIIYKRKKIKNSFEIKFNDYKNSLKAVIGSSSNPEDFTSSKDEVPF